MAAIQLAFTLRTSANCKTVHLVGSWDSYRGQLPLSKDSSKTGGWKGTFRFQTATLKHGQRYWYYYIIDGYHVSHDPTRDSVLEPTTQRKLNILDVPSDRSSGKPSLKVETSSRSSKRSSRDAAPTTKRHSRNTPADIPIGRPVDPSHIAHPRPQKPGQTKYITMTDFSGHATVDTMTRKFAATRLVAPRSPVSDSDDDASDIDSDAGSDVPSLTSRSSRSSSSSIHSGSSSPRSACSSSCSCERYGITRKGDRVRLDCGGSRCGYSSGSDICVSDSEEDSEIEDDADRYHISAGKRHGVVVRGPPVSYRTSRY